MMTLRCTQRALNWFKLSPQKSELPATTTLGDWYANLLFTRHQRLLMCTSEKSLLCVLIPIKQLPNLEAGFVRAVREHLLRIGAPEKLVEAEIAQMNPIIIGKTNNRSVLGSMRDFTIGAKAHFEYGGKDVKETEKMLAETICGPLKNMYPKEVAIERLNYWSKRLIN
jgi:hypothetical protein